MESQEAANGAQRPDALDSAKLNVNEAAPLAPNDKAAIFESGDDEAMLALDPASE